MQAFRPSGRNCGFPLGRTRPRANKQSRWPRHEPPKQHHYADIYYVAPKIREGPEGRNGKDLK
jgi:hypothetical protein